MGNARIVVRNLADLAALTATTAVATLPVTNLAVIDRALVCRSTGLILTISGTWASAHSVSMLALCRHNLTAAATWRVRVYDNTALTGTPLHDSGTVTAWPFPVSALDAVEDDGEALSAFRGLKTSADWFTAAPGVRGFSVELTDTGNAAGYIEAARLWIGDYYELPWAPEYGAQGVWQDPSTQARSMGGTLRSEAAIPFRRLTMNLNAGVPASERPRWMEMHRYCGLRREIFFSLLPGRGDRDERDHMLNGKFGSIDPISWDLPTYCSLPLTIEEC